MQQWSSRKEKKSTNLLLPVTSMPSSPVASIPHVPPSHHGRKVQAEPCPGRRRPIDYLLRCNGQTSSPAATAAHDYAPGLAGGGSRRADGRSGDGSSEDTERFWMKLLSLGLEEKQGRGAGGGGGSEEGSGAETDKELRREKIS
ncbi:heat stress transcription factor A-2a [Brachypodium distachyon]|uniref:heat stress transcription factor A-2a n=1 Tax=Brachypodium distachyon TaxID=15368 RepID=UPI000D0CB035|nr:heat stress transcription factor A-2a [Brachypodium distachyon]|eukprot:XP_014754050.2 heat stress transcription factor A-2a [Brachypodium distachyon]